jgi:imidazolonepropionase-like amidohydrolase
VNCSLLLKNVSVLAADGSFTEPQDVAVENGLVSGVGKNLTSMERATYDLTGLWLMPGVFDCHDHITLSTLDEAERFRTPITSWCLESVRNFRATLEAGVTFVRDCAGADAGMRDAIERGVVDGPRLQVSINVLSQTGGHADGFLHGLGVQSSLTPSWPGKPPNVVDGVDSMRRISRQLLRDGADWIKLCATGGTLSPHDLADQPQFTREEIEVAVFEGRRRGVSVAAHAYGAEGLTNAVAAGVRSIEHGVYLTEEQAAQLAAADCYLVPTLAIQHDVVRWAEEGRILPPFAAGKALEIKPFIGDQVKIAREAGVKMAVGTDYGHREQHGRNLEELWYMHQAGLSSEETFLAATKNGADLCGVSDRYGSIEAGYVFDALVIGRDPGDLRIFAEPASVVAVFKSGRCASGHDLLDERAADRVPVDWRKSPAERATLS